MQFLLIYLTSATIEIVSSQQILQCFSSAYYYDVLFQPWNFSWETLARREPTMIPAKGIWGLFETGDR
jgi:hypothetical protein